MIKTLWISLLLWCAAVWSALLYAVFVNAWEGLLVLGIVLVSIAPPLIHAIKEVR